MPIFLLFHEFDIDMKGESIFYYIIEKSIKYNKNKQQNVNQLVDI